MTKTEYQKISDIVIDTINEIHDENMALIGKNKKMTIEELYHREMIMGVYGGIILRKIKKML